ncbi:MAG TPA: hypothetical protein VF691_14725 [Cytophagaceae bacterium]|jgi:hypothetical protein
MSDRKKKYSWWMVTGVLALLFSCDIKKNEVSPSESYFRIFDNNKIGGNLYPIDIQQNADGGFTILGSANLWDTYIIQTDAFGKITFDSVYAQYVNPVGDLAQSADRSSCTFFAMDRISRGTYLLKINAAGFKLDTVNFFPQLSFLLHSSPTPDGGYIVESSAIRSDDDIRILVAKLSSQHQVEWDNEYDALENISDKIYGHVYRRGVRYPFKTGFISNSLGYYVNIFKEYRLTTQFIDLAGNDKGQLDGYQYQGGVSAIQHYSENTFTLAGFTLEKSYILPMQNVDANATQSLSSLPARELFDVDSRAEVVMKSIQIGGKSIVIYGSTTKNKRIILQGYDPTTGNFIGQKYIGSGFGYELGNFVTTNDGGLAVLAKTNIAGRYDRLCLFKLSQSDIKVLSGN